MKLKLLSVFCFCVTLIEISKAQNPTGYIETFSKSGILGDNYYTNANPTNQQWQADYITYPQKWYVEGQGTEQTLILDSINHAVLKVNKPTSLPKTFAGTWFQPRKILDLSNHKYFTIKISAFPAVKIDFDVFDVNYRRYGHIVSQNIGNTDKTLTFSLNETPSDVDMDFSKISSILINVGNMTGYTGTIYFSDFKIGDQVSNTTLQLTTTNNAVTCKGLNNGSAMVNVTGGFPPYSYSWNTNPIQTTASIQNLAVGTYTIKVIDAKAQIDSATVNIVELPFIANAGPDQSLCVGNSVALQAQAIADAIYQWSPPQSLSDAIVVRPSANPSQTTSYVLNVKSGNCTASDTVKVTVIPTPSTVASSNSPICEGGSLKLTSTAGSSAATYNWTGPNGFNSSTENPSIVNVTSSASGDYSVVLAESGCPSPPATVAVSIQSLPKAEASSNGTVLCPGGTLNLNTAKASSTAVYSWTGPNGFTSILQAPSIYNVKTTDAGTYTVVTTDGYCSSSPSYIVISVNNSPNIISGFAKQSNNSFLPSTKVLLVSMDKDSIVSIADSTVTSNNGFFSFIYTSTDNKYVKIIPDIDQYPNLIPTYYNNTLTIQDAMVIHSSCDSIGMEIIAKEGINLGGPGFIGGKLGLASGRIASGSISNISLLLINNKDEVMQITKTDANGNFQFSNLPLGTYKILVDKIGIDNSKAPSIALTSQSSSQSKLQFALHSTYLENKNVAAVEVENISSHEILISPNPLDNFTTISYSVSYASNVSFAIYNIMGELISTIDQGYKEQGSFNYQYYTNLSAGIYFLKTSIGQNISVEKIIINK